MAEPKLVRPYLDDILECIREIEQAMMGVSAAEYSANWILKSGVERGIEIISEAARRIPEHLRAEQPQIPWKLVLGIGNVLRHEYKLVADNAIYQVVLDDLAPLKSAILAIEASLDEPEE